MSASTVSIILSCLCYFVAILLWKEAVKMRRELNHVQKRNSVFIKNQLEYGERETVITQNDFEHSVKVPAPLTQRRDSEQIAFLSMLFFLLGFLPLMICIANVLKPLGWLN